jgi:RNA-directed DNA polymerase
MNEFYNVYTLPTGRTIEEPVPALKKLQSHILTELEQTITFPDCVHGGVRGRSIKTNALVHRGAKYILKMDIKKFFRSTTFQHVHSGLAGYVGVLPELINDFVFCFYDNHLPTGAPTSPFLGNIACYGLDICMMDHAEQMQYKYTRYIDDITISQNTPTRNWELISFITDIVTCMGYRINSKKTRWMTTGSDNMLVTGITQDKEGRFRVARTFYRNLRDQLYLEAKISSFIPEELKGKLSYVYSVSPEQYIQLMDYHARIVNGRIA